MKIAYLDHYYHQRTNSTRFVLDLLQGAGDVDEFWDESAAGGPAPDARAIAGAGYDLVVVFQTEWIVPALVREGCDNIVFIPMWDSCQSLRDSYWRSIIDVKIVSFSRFLHEKLVRFGNRSAYFQYFQNPDVWPRTRDFSTKRGFFWHRRDEFTWHQVHQLIGDTPFERFHLHGAVDPGSGDLISPSEGEIARHNIRISTWFEKKQDYVDCLRAANIFFAPRIAEGLGQTLLEALSLGQCIVAPDRPTMNEYILQGVNGLLVDDTKPAPVDFSNAADLGARARETAELGYARWAHDLDDRLPELLLSPGGVEMPIYYDFGAKNIESRISELRSAAKSEPESDHARARGGDTPSGPIKPRVTIATVVLNGQETIERTLLSALAQDYPNKEIIVIDGGSTDETHTILRRFEGRIDRWLSESDSGPFDAMNKAAGIAGGEWILFMNAGDWFYASDVVSRSLAHAPADADFVIGHHMYRDDQGILGLHRAANFEATWQNLVTGDIGIKGIPCHQATFTKTRLLRENPYDLSYRIAADHEYLYRAKAAGASFFNANEIIAVYSDGGISMSNYMRCVDEWWKIDREYGPPDKVDKFYRSKKRKNILASIYKKLGVGKYVNKLRGSAFLCWLSAQRQARLPTTTKRRLW